MKRQFVRVRNLTIFACMASLVLTAQQSTIAPDLVPSSAVPNLINYVGVLKDANGRPATGITGVMFLFYADQEGAPRCGWRRRMSHLTIRDTTRCNWERLPLTDFRLICL